MQKDFFNSIGQTTTSPPGLVCQLPPATDIGLHEAMYEKCNNPTLAPLLDHFICTQQDRLRDFQPKRLRSSEIDDKVEFGRLLDR